MITKLKYKWREADPSLKAFLYGVFFLGINAGVLNAAFNNYLHDSFKMSAEARGFLELPREFPGFMLIFITGSLAALPVRWWAILTAVLSALGVFGMGFLSPSVVLMTLWMFSWSIGGHLFMAVESVIGLRLAKEGAQGRRLGQISGMTNFASIAGAGLVLLFASIAGQKVYSFSFLLAGIAAAVSAIFFAQIKDAPEESGAKSKRFVFRKSYKYYYILNIFMGARKQIFLTFAPWVLVTVYGANPGVMATLIMVASVLGVAFRQVFGIVVDKFGERVMFIADAVILLVICAAFAFSTNLWLLYGIYILDNLMFATRIARTTYLNKIAEKKTDIPPTISLGITMDHAISMTVPTLGGILWASCGYRSVFYAASLLAVAAFGVALAVKDKVVKPDCIPNTVL